MPATQEPASSATIPLLHRMLMIGLVATDAMMLWLRYRGFEIEGWSPDRKETLTYVLAACSLIPAAVALVIFKPRVPIRRPDQSSSQYWSMPEVATNVLAIWFLTEGGGVVAAVGYLLTGSQISVISMGLTVALYWVYGPGRFADG